MIPHKAGCQGVWVFTRIYKDGSCGFECSTVVDPKSFVRFNREPDRCRAWVKLVPGPPPSSVRHFSLLLICFAHIRSVGP